MEASCPPLAGNHSEVAARTAIVVHIGDRCAVVSLEQDYLALESRLSRLKREEHGCELAAVAQHLGLLCGEEAVGLVLAVAKRALSPPPPAPTEIGCIGREYMGVLARNEGASVPWLEAGDPLLELSEHLR